MELEKVVYRIKFQLETMIRKKRVKEYFDWPDAKPVWKNITSYVTFVHRRGYRSRMRPKDYHHHNLTNSSSFEDSFLEEGSGPWRVLPPIFKRSRGLGTENNGNITSYSRNSPLVHRRQRGNVKRRAHDAYARGALVTRRCTRWRRRGRRLAWHVRIRRAAERDREKERKIRRISSMGMHTRVGSPLRIS